MSQEQKEDVLNVFGKKWKNVGNLDYVCCWYKLAAEYMKGSDIKAALVSTNSVSQGEQVANLWKPLIEDLGVRLNFAWRTFRWDSEASLKAHVHCVIIGFSYVQSKKPIIFDVDSKIECQNLSPYLCDAPNVFIESRSKAICSIPDIGIGNKPIDGGFYLFEEEEMKEFVSREPKSVNYFRPWYGSQEFLQNKKRFCLWLGNVSPTELNSMPECKSRVASVREFRLNSSSEGTRKLADKPTRFHVENMPNSEYLLIPKVSSEKRYYVPMGYMTPDIMSSDLVFIMPNTSLYHFGLLESLVHMSWMRAVCGRLEMRYRYSKDIVYNNFPWPTPTDAQKAKIEKTAQAILDARNLYPDSSLADLYDEVAMPYELRRAHQENDKAVMEAYGFNWKNMTEADIVAALFKLYQELTQK